MTTSTSGDGGVSWSRLMENDQTLCDPCKQFLAEMRTPRMRSRKRETINGCRFCDIIREGMEKVFPDSEPVPEGRGRVFQVSRNAPSFISVGNLDLTKPVTCNLWITEDIKNENPISFIKSNLTECLGHGKCKEALRKPIDPGSWPARIIEILDDSIRVVKFKDDSMGNEFAALSYCWGSPAELRGNPPYKLTTSTIAELQSNSGVPISKMPRTLRDAFDLCKLLGIPHIWIDALCILQSLGPGDLMAIQDWETESMKMETVYSRAKLTIIAASADSCHTGFLDSHLHNDPLAVDSAQPLLHGTQFSDLQVVARESRGIGSGFHLHSLFECRDPIGKRSWTYQEEILSTRYIKLTEHDVQWKCETSTQCVCQKRATDIYLQQWKFRRPLETGVVSIRRWMTMACYYFTRSVTVESDRLVAISGIARRLARDIKPPRGLGPGSRYYHAGIWNCELQSETVYQLTWQNLRPLWRVDGSSCLYNEYVAPTFSWLSLNGEGGLLSFHEFGFDLEGINNIVCEIIGMETTLVRKEDPFGRPAL